MIKYIMRKTIYKEFDKESQDMLLQLTAKKKLIERFCLMIWAVIYVWQLIPLFIICIFEDIEISMTTQIIIITFMLMYFVGLIVSAKIFKEAMLGFSLLLSKKIYFLVCTTKGKALCKNELNTIKKENPELYLAIETQRCQGYCYSICFEICKTLKKGAIEFLAVKQFSPHKDKENFTIHVLYVNNEWAFDTYSSRQYPIENLHKIYKAKVYKTFDFEEISNKSFKEFREEHISELANWAKDNDCSIFSNE